MQWNPCKAVPALAACLLSIHLGAADAEAAARYTVQDEKQESTFLALYQVRFFRYDPESPPGEEPALIEIEAWRTDYNIAGTEDPGVFRHHIQKTVFPDNGQQIPGFCVFRCKHMGANQWVNEEELSFTWHPN